MSSSIIKDKIGLNVLAIVKKVGSIRSKEFVQSDDMITLKKNNKTVIIHNKNIIKMETLESDELLVYYKYSQSVYGKLSDCDNKFFSITINDTRRKKEYDVVFSYNELRGLKVLGEDDDLDF